MKPAPALAAVHVRMCRPLPEARGLGPVLLPLVVAVAMASTVQAKEPPARMPGTPAAGPARPAAAASFKTVGWDDLLPADWEPAAEFKGVDLTRLADNDPRAAKLFKRLREIWDNAPANPALQGSALRIAGYVVPLEETPQGMTEFLLVPHFGACIHTPPPPANQIVHVRTGRPVKGLASMDAVWISGEMKVTRSDTGMGVSGYAMDAVRVDPYSRQQR
jgi:hypothetical protein